MQIYSKEKTERNPVIQLLFLGFLAIGGVLIFMALAFLVIFLMGGAASIKSLAGNEQDLNAVKVFLVAQHLGLFLTPALLLALTESKKPSEFYGLKKPAFKPMVIVVVLMACAMPFISKVIMLNQEMVLPSFFKETERWMQTQEKLSAALTEKLLMMKNAGDFLSALVMIAVMPAICEEFIFRGAIQRCFKRWVKNIHVAIWVTAIVFSAIHFQFYGFFPRMLLGAGLGYIYFYTGNLWYAVFGHLLNNASAVTVAYYLQLQGKPITDEAEISVGWLGAFISLLLTLLLFKFLKEQSYKETVNLAKEE